MVKWMVKVIWVSTSVGGEQAAGLQTTKKERRRCRIQYKYGSDYDDGG